MLALTRYLTYTISFTPNNSGFHWGCDLCLPGSWLYHIMPVTPCSRTGWLTFKSVLWEQDWWSAELASAPGSFHLDKVLPTPRTYHAITYFHVLRVLFCLECISHLNASPIWMLRQKASYSNFSSPVTPSTQPRPSLTIRPQGSTLLWDDQCYLHESFYWDFLSLFDFVSPHRPWALWGPCSVQFSSVPQSCPTLCEPCTTARQASLSIISPWSLPKLMSIVHPTVSSSVVPFSSRQHQGLFQWVSSSHQVEFQLQHQSFQWTPRTDLL